MIGVASAHTGFGQVGSVHICRAVAYEVVSEVQTIVEVYPEGYAVVLDPSGLQYGNLTHVMEVQLSHHTRQFDLAWKNGSRKVVQYTLLNRGVLP